MNDTQVDQSASVAAKASPRHHFWEDSWVGVFLLMLISAILGGLLSRLWPGGDGLFSTPSGEISERVAALDARVIQLANAQSATPAADLDAVRERLGALEDRVKSAETALASNPQSKTVVGATVPMADAQLASLEAAAKQIQDMQARLAVLELGSTSTAASPAAPGAAVDLQTIKADLAKANETVLALSTRLDAVTAKLASAVDPSPLIATVRADVDVMKGRVDKIEQADLVGSARRAALGAAVASLSRAAQSGQPFQAELSVVRSLQPNDPALTALSAFAAKGAPVQSAIQASFAAQADDAIKAERDAKSGEGLDRLWSGVTSMVSVRATGTPDGTDTASVLARAEAKLKAGDIRAAHAETNRLQGPARAAMENWRRDADARVKLDATISALSRSIADSLSRSAAAPAAPAATP